MKRHRIAVIAGDGIGPEVVRFGVQILDEAARLDGGFELEFEELPWGSAYFLEHGRMMPDDAQELDFLGLSRQRAANREKHRFKALLEPCSVPSA